ncbi:MAG TPA: signal peptidase II [Desulfobacteraceae bacterium]|nr:signal peptidase II [Desulfobacteraceae bacterium]
MNRLTITHAAAFLLTLLLDQATKLAVAAALPVYGSISVIPGFFNLVHVRNKGMAFGMMNRPDSGFFFIFLVVASIAAIVVLGYWYLSRRESEKFSVSLGICLMMGGAVGNLIDRLRLGEVIDFIDLYLGSYHWPAFNIADMAVSCGALLVAAGVLRAGKSRSN